MPQCRGALVERLFSVDARSLALLRIGVAAIILLDLCVTRMPDLPAFYSDSGMLPISISGGPEAAPGHWSIHEWSNSPAYQAGLMSLGAVTAAFLLVGCLTRIATVVSWVLAISLANRNLLVCNYGDTLLQLFLFWSIWIPWGATWSVDAWRHGRRAPAESADRRICSVATACAMLQLAVLYFFGGLWKWNSDWLAGTAIEHALLLEYATRPTAQLLLRFPGLLRPLTHATLALELLGPLLVWVPWQTERIRLAMVAAFVALHVGIELTFTPLYLSHICIVAWSLFLPATVWRWRGLRRLTEAWDAWMRRLANRAVTGVTTDIWLEARPALKRGLRWTINSLLLLFMAYILVWNIASYQVEKFGFLLPERARWIGHVTSVRQTWDMFWIPSRYNGWFEARAHVANGRWVDLIGNGRPLPVDPPAPNWSSMPNSRWKVYFRRLTENPDPELCQLVADYLWRTWNERHSDEQRVKHLDLVLIRRVLGTKSGAEGITEEILVRRQDPAADPLEDVLRRLSGESLDGVDP